MIMTKNIHSIKLINGANINSINSRESGGPATHGGRQRLRKRAAGSGEIPVRVMTSFGDRQQRCK